MTRTKAVQRAASPTANQLPPSTSEKHDRGGLAAKQIPPRPGPAPALGLRAGQTKTSIRGFNLIDASGANQPQCANASQKSKNPFFLRRSIQ